MLIKGLHSIRFKETKSNIKMTITMPKNKNQSDKSKISNIKITKINKKCKLFKGKAADKDKNKLSIINCIDTNPKSTCRPMIVKSCQLKDIKKTETLMTLKKDKNIKIKTNKHQNGLILNVNFNLRISYKNTNMNNGHVNKIVVMQRKITNISVKNYF